MSMPKRAPCNNRCLTSTVPRSTGAASDSATDGNSRPVVPGPAPQSGSNSSSGPAVMLIRLDLDPQELFRTGALGLRGATSAQGFEQIA